MTMDNETLRRFMAKFHRSGTCWLWRNNVGRDGYGRCWINRSIASPHRVSYEHFVGPIMDGLHIDHLCRNRRCVNPEHLEPVTPRENCLRGESRMARAAKQTHCIHGHEFAGRNLIIKKDGHRACRECSVIRVRLYQRARRKKQTAMRKALRESVQSHKPH